MAENEATEVDETPEAPAGEAQAGDDSLVDAVDDRAAELTGAAGAEATDAPIPSNAGAVADAEAHLEETDLTADRDTLKKIQSQM